MFRAAVITVSDKGFAGERSDESGAAVQDILRNSGYDLVYYKIFPDERIVLAETLKDLCDNYKADLIITTGGTGFSERDITPEATLEVGEKNVPGIAEAMRFYSLQKTPKAILSRGVSVIRAKTLIINLPGSKSGATENLECVLPVISHGLDVLTRGSMECGK